MQRSVFASWQAGTEGFFVMGRAPFFAEELDLKACGLGLHPFEDSRHEQARLADEQEA
jgi:hypothetical protein